LFTQEYILRLKTSKTDEVSGGKPYTYKGKINNIFNLTIKSLETMP